MNSIFSGEAKWIWCKGGNWQICSETPVQTCYFRREFLGCTGDTLHLHVSADSRYTLYFNGERLGSGPAKGDIAHQFYDTYDVSDKIIDGKNLIAAVVTNYSAVFPNYSGVSVPVSLMTAMPGFIVDAVLQHGDDTESLHTNEKWLAMLDKSVSHIINPKCAVLTDLNECVDYQFYPEDWEKLSFRGGGFEPCAVKTEGVKDDTVVDSSAPYRLLPRMIPFMREKIEFFDSVYSVSGIDVKTVERCIQGGKMVIPPESSVRFVLRIKETTAYPMLAIDKGTKAQVKLIYSEGLYHNGIKTVRTEFEDPENVSVIGMFDMMIGDGKYHDFETSHWRTIRFMQVEIETDKEEIVLSDIKTRFNAYPYDLLCEFECSNKHYSEIMKIAFRTLQLCSHETYEDCPYYEQLQYMGDSQVIALIAGMSTGDWELQRQLILQFYWSLDNEGIPQSRYPTRIPQKIISWALLWSVCVADYFQHTDDSHTVSLCMDGVVRMLDGFKKYIGEQGLLFNLPYWKVVDWVWEWRDNCGAPMGANGGTSALISSQFAYCLKRASTVLNELGAMEKAQEYTVLAEKITGAVNKYAFDQHRRLYLDSPEHTLSSELANAWAILAGCADKELAREICERFEYDESIAKATMYGRFYVFRAMSQCGAYDKFPEMLKLWLEIMKSNLETFPEEPRFERSYCHAWSAVPIYEFLTEILGVKVLSKRHKTIEITPNQCGLDFAKGKVPTTVGDIYVKWEVVKGELNICVQAPKDVKIVSKFNIIK